MSTRIVISDTTAIIHLSKIGALTILQSLYSKIYIPEAVYNEITMHGDNMPGAWEVKNFLWINAEKVKNRSKVQLLATTLDIGESEAIALAIEKRADLLIIDEKSGRAAAKAEGLTFTGVVGVLLNAKTKKIIPAVKPYLDMLNNTGFKMNITLYNDALRLANEQVTQKKA